MFADADEDTSANVVRYPCMPSLISLQQMRARLLLAQTGKKLMAWTATATGRELRKIAHDIDDAYRGFREDMANCFILLARARFAVPYLNHIALENLPKEKIRDFLLGINNMTLVLSEPLPPRVFRTRPEDGRRIWPKLVEPFSTEAAVHVEHGNRSVSGVKINLMHIVDSGRDSYPNLGLGRGGEIVLQVKKEWRRMLIKIIKLCELRQAYLDLELAHKNATKKKQMLAKIVVPRLKETIQYIKSELEEKEREDTFRLKRFKQLKEKAKAIKKETTTCLKCGCRFTSVENQPNCPECTDKNQTKSINESDQEFEKVAGKENINIDESAPYEGRDLGKKRSCECGCKNVLGKKETEVSNIKEPCECGCKDILGKKETESSMIKEPCDCGCKDILQKREARKTESFKLPCQCSDENKNDCLCKCKVCPSRDKIFAREGLSCVCNPTSKSPKRRSPNPSVVSLKVSKDNMLNKRDRQRKLKTSSPKPCRTPDIPCSTKSSESSVKSLGKQRSTKSISEKELGTFEKQINKTIKVIRLKNPDGTIREEKEIITVRIERRMPLGKQVLGDERSEESFGSNRGVSPKAYKSEPIIKCDRFPNKTSEQSLDESLCKNKAKGTSKSTSCPSMLNRVLPNRHRTPCSGSYDNLSKRLNSWSKLAIKKRGMKAKSSCSETASEDCRPECCIFQKDCCKTITCPSNRPVEKDSKPKCCDVSSSASSLGKRHTNVKKTSFQVEMCTSVPSFSNQTQLQRFRPVSGYSKDISKGTCEKTVQSELKMNLLEQLDSIFQSEMKQDILLKEEGTKIRDFLDTDSDTEIEIVRCHSCGSITIKSRRSVPVASNDKESREVLDRRDSKNLKSIQFIADDVYDRKYRRAKSDDTFNVIKEPNLLSVTKSGPSCSYRSDNSGFEIRGTRKDAMTETRRSAKFDVRGVASTPISLQSRKKKNCKK